jgi:hypothetical protein
MTNDVSVGTEVHLVPTGITVGQWCVSCHHAGKSTPAPFIEDGRSVCGGHLEVSHPSETVQP